jgi:hypothetical protein
MAGSCECGDEPAGSGAMELVYEAFFLEQVNHCYLVNSSIRGFPTLNLSHEPGSCFRFDDD